MNPATTQKRLGDGFYEQKLIAGRDLNVTSTTRSSSNQNGANTSNRTHIDRIAGLYVTDSGGTLLAQAGRDISFDAAAILNAAPPAAGKPAGSTTLAAGNNLNLGTVTTSASNRIVWDGDNSRSDSSRSDIGTRIQTQGDLRLSAGNDLNAKAANATSAQGALVATAGNNLNLTAGEANRSIEEAHQYKGRSGLFSSKTTTTRDTLNETTAPGTTLSGNTVTVLANRDINLKGSNLVSTQGTTLAAGNNLNVEAASNTTVESHFRDEKKSGLFSNGGLSITLGSQQQSVDNRGAGTSAAASTVGSTQGSIDIQAVKTYTQTGSDVLAPQGNIDISAQKIDITEAQNVSRSSTETRFKQSGLTVALTSPVISAIQTAGQMKEAAGNTRDGRMQALAGATAALAAKNAYDAVQASPAQAGGVNLSISLGASQSKSNNAQTASTAAGSTVAAGGDVNLAAMGAGENSDLTVQGSTVKAGNNATLNAEDGINLLAARNTAEQNSTNSSSSGSIGVSFGTNGLMVTASASKGRGNADGSDVTWTKTRVDAGNQVAMASGSDATLKGAVVAAPQITATVGGNLNVESLQDTSQYSSKQQSLGGSLSVGYGKMGGSFNAGKSKIDSDFASVGEQSGIKAGDEGFKVEVKGNTDLKGAMIASTDRAVQEQKNTLTTATLTQSDIQNKAEASANSSGIALSSDMFTQGKYGIAKGVIGNALNNASESGSSGGQTRSAVSAGTVTITGEEKQKQLTGKTAGETVVGLNRDTANAQTAAQKQDVQAMERAVQAERAIKQAAFAEAVKFTDEAYRTAFIKKHPMYEIVKGKDGNTQFDEKTGRPILRELSEQEKLNLKPGPDGKVHIAANGIFNDADAAGTYANQHSTTQGPQYVIHFPEANNALSELLVAGYQKFLENDFTGLTNSTIQVKDAMSQYGQSGLHLDGHSRGAMTIGNALESQAKTNDPQGGLNQTTINFFGPAYNAQQADNLLSPMQDRQRLPAAQQPATVLQFQNHAADPVGGLVGQNPSTGGTIPEGSSPAREAVRAGTGQKNTSHNCYGQSRDDACANLWQDTGGFPIYAPAQGGK